MPAPIVLMYHNICPPPPTAQIKGMYVDPRQFDWQIRWLLKHGFDITTFAQLTDKPAHARSVVLTLDDGYANNYSAAFPILQRHGVSAVIYPILTDLGKSRVTWPIGTERTPADLMTVPQVQEMAAAGIEFGSHLLHHKPLTEMSPDQCEQELSASREQLQAMTGQKVLSIAYPYGAFDDVIVGKTEQCGYQYAVTTLPGVNGQGTHPLRLSRFTAKGCKIHHRMKFRRMLKQAAKEAEAQWPALKPSY